MVFLIRHFLFELIHTLFLMEDNDEVEVPMTVLEHYYKGKFIVHSRTDFIAAVEKMLGISKGTSTEEWYHIYDTKKISGLTYFKCMRMVSCVMGKPTQDPLEPFRCLQTMGSIQLPGVKVGSGCSFSPENSA